MTEAKTDALAPMKPRDTLLAMIDKNKQAIIDHLPEHCNEEKMLRVIRTALQTTPALWNCTPASVMESVIDASALGLEPNGPLGDSALVPFNNRKTGTTECQLMVMYRGYIELGDRTGKVAYFDAQVVRTGDEFEFAYGTEPYLRHVPKTEMAKQKEPDGVECVYALVKFTNGFSKFVVLSVEEVEEIRACSRAKMGPAWTKWWGEMAKKTALRRLMKYVRLSPELSRAAYLDEALDAGLRPGEAIDITDRVRDASDENTDRLKERLGEASVDTSESDDDAIDTTAEVVEDVPPTPKEFDPIDSSVFGADSKFHLAITDILEGFTDLACNGLGLSVEEAIEKWRKKVVKLLSVEGATKMDELTQTGKQNVVRALAAACKDFEAALNEKQCG